MLSSREVENIFENSDMIIMLNQAAGDRQILAKQLDISPHQLSYVTHSGDYQKTKWWHGCFSFRRPAAANQPPWIALSILFAKQASYSVPEMRSFSIA